ncbi:MAG: hypothetical protein ACOX47_05015 [Bacillota bacterium]|jgi:phosphoribosylanthranilate isomerase
MTGVKTLKDAEEAILLGAAAIGIKMGYGKDDVHPETAREIFFSLPVFISRVGIFCDEKRYHIQELVTFCRLDTLHFCGQEQPDDVKRYPENVIKNFSPQSLSQVKDYDIQGVILELTQGIFMNIEVETITNPALILCGNLTHTEWVRAIKKYRPYGIQWDLNNNSRKILEDLLFRK